MSNPPKTFPPGPYTVGASEELTADAEQGIHEYRVAVISEDGEVGAAYAYHLQQAEAIAALFAAAPDLLTACEKALWLLEGTAEACMSEGRRNAAMNVRETEAVILSAVRRARRKT